MPITKTQLKKIASEAWEKCYDNVFKFNNFKYEVYIQMDGNKDLILSVLKEYSESMNEKDNNLDYYCGAYYRDNKYVFYVKYVNESCANYEFDEDEEEEENEIVAESVINQSSEETDQP